MLALNQDVQNRLYNDIIQMGDNIKYEDMWKNTKYLDAVIKDKTGSKTGSDVII